MPASRQRGERWQNTLEQIRDRRGSVEITIDRRADTGFRTDPGVEVLSPPPDLLWRVRVREAGETGIVVDSPAALGRDIELRPGTRLVVVMAVGQNRWMFQSRVAAVLPGPDGGLRLDVPARVERCTRRAQQRISTAEINFPRVRCWHLADPVTAVPAAAASRERIAALIADPAAPRPDDPLDALSEIAPVVGPSFPAELANIGGGGVGLKIGSDESALVESTRLYWMKLDLRPVIPAPLELTARLAHTHLDSAQNIYAGMAFEFGLDPSHKSFVADMIERYMRHATAPR